MKLLKRSLFLATTLLFLISVQTLIILNAQETCFVLAQQSFANLSEVCDEFGANSACWIDETTQVESLLNVDTLISSSTDDALGTAKMHVPANVPLASSPNGLIYIVLGDLMIENLVAADNAFIPSEAVTVTVLVGANLRGRASANSNIVASVAPGTELAADAMSSDQAWVRVVYDDALGWISRQLVVLNDGTLDDLPILGANSWSLMQDFTLRKLPSESACGSMLPSLLLIQSPNNMDSTIIVNGKAIRFDDTIVIMLIDNRLQVVSLNGGISSDGVQIGSGFTMSIGLSGDGSTVDGFWEGVRPINPDERLMLTLLEYLSSPFMHSDVEVPSQAEIASLIQGLNASGGTGGARTFSDDVDCSGFHPTSPLTAVQAGFQPFYWDAAPGADQYVVNMRDEFGAFLGSLSIGSFTTSLNIDANGIAGGRGNIVWSVDAIADGQLACTSDSVLLQILPSANVQVEVNTSDNNAPDPIPQATSPPPPTDTPPPPTTCSWGSCS